jgi:hypothetical protein
VAGPLDATDCDIGVYYRPGATGNVSSATISGARYFGVVVDGIEADITASEISQIGECRLTAHSTASRSTT